MRRFPFEYNGMVLHELFFEQLSGTNGRPRTSKVRWGKPWVTPSAASTAGAKDFENLANTRGIGWVMTVREKSGGTLYNTWVDEHQWGTTAGTEVIFLLDLWEHAYLLDFSPKQRGDYLQAVFDNVDWSVVESRMK